MLKCNISDITSLHLQPTLLKIWRARVASESFTLLLWNILYIGLLHQKARITNRSTFVCGKLFTNIRHKVKVSILHSHCGVFRRESSEVCILSPIVEHSDTSECHYNKAWQAGFRTWLRVQKTFQLKAWHIFTSGFSMRMCHLTASINRKLWIINKLAFWYILCTSVKLVWYILFNE